LLEVATLAPDELDTDALESEPVLSEATRSLLHFTSFFLALARLEFLGCFGVVGLSRASEALSFAGTKSPDGDDNSKFERRVGSATKEGCPMHSDCSNRRGRADVAGQGGAAVGSPALFSKADGALKLDKVFSDSLLM
jgi:hypothetical protein